MPPEERREVCLAVLDHMRRELAIYVQHLERDEQDKIKHRSEQRLREPWVLERESHAWMAAKFDRNA